MKMMNVPDNLDLEVLKEKFPTELSFKHQKAVYTDEKVYFVCSLIYRMSMKLDEHTMKYAGKWAPYYVPISSEVLSHYVSTNSYKPLLEWMTVAGIIECDGIYSRGNSSMGYRFTPTYMNCMYRREPMTSLTLENRKPFKWANIEVVNSSKTVKGLFKWFNGLEIDEVPAKQEIQRRYELEMQKNKRRKKHKQEENAKKIHNNRHNNNLIVDEIVSGCRDREPHQDPSGRRLHSIITSLPKFLRGYVSYKGAPLAQADLKNSQLVCILYLFILENWKRNKLSPSHIVWKGLGISKPYTGSSDTNLNTNKYLTGSKGRTKTQASKAFEEMYYDSNFSQMVLNNGIYEHLVGRLDEVGGFFPANMKFKNKRKKVKGLLLPQMFANENLLNPKWRYKNSKSKVPIKDPKMDMETRCKHTRLYRGKNKMLWEIFKEDFPEVYKLFCHIKNESHKNLSSVLQRIESTAVLEYACKLISEKLPNAPIFVLHDCIVTTEDYIKAVNDLFIKGIEMFIGHNPNTTIEYWSDYRQDSKEKFAA